MLNPLIICILVHGVLNLVGSTTGILVLFFIVNLTFVKISPKKSINIDKLGDYFGIWFPTTYPYIIFPHSAKMHDGIHEKDRKMVRQFYDARNYINQT